MPEQSPSDWHHSVAPPRAADGERRAALSNSRALGTSQDFGIDQCTLAPHLDVIEYFAPIQLERTVHVTEVEPQNQVHQPTPGPGIQLANPGILPLIR